MTRTNKLTPRWTRYGVRRALAALAGRVLARCHRMEYDSVYLVQNVPSDRRDPAGFDLSLREVPMEETLAWAPELYMPPRVTATRFAQGARRYAAIWDGRGVDVCWAIAGRKFHDRADGFCLDLGARDCYVFDYQGFHRGRPPAFGRFVLMRALVRYVIDQENRRLGGGGRFYSIVDRRNRVSVYFHERVLSAATAGTFRTRWILGKPTLLPDGAMPTILATQPGTVFKPRNPICHPPAP